MSSYIPRNLAHSAASNTLWLQTPLIIHSRPTLKRTSSMRSLRSLSLVLFFAVMETCMLRASEIGFEEDFALSGNREETLKQLIPGTDDYYYYHCVHYQN